MQRLLPLSFCSRCHAGRFASLSGFGTRLSDLLLACLLSALLLGCATPYHSEKSFWNGQTGFSHTRLAPDKWQLEFVGNELIDRETARKYVLKRAGEIAQSQGYEWVDVNELTLSRDAVRVTPSHPVFGFDTDEPDPFLTQMQVQHSTSALLIFTLSHRSLNERCMKANYLANIKINSD
ncbi:CC0125/CC1285 family lipoprotein [Aeromonas enterica]